MAKLFAQVRFIAGVLALAFMVVTTVPATQASAQNAPTAAANEQQMLQQFKMIQGRGSIPDVKSYVLEHPAGRDWRTFHTVTLRWIGAIAIIGMLALVVIFYLWRGKIEIEGGRSGRTILRFNAFERFVHWLTASTFIVLGITGLNITFGRSVLLPWMGPQAFSTWSEWAKYTHNYLSFAFTIGVVLVFLIWIGQNLPNANDIAWLKRGGNLFSKTHHDAPSGKFNGGQKGLYWLVVLGGAAMIISGYMLMFPFYYGMTVGNMELAEVFHGVVGMLYVALIIAHVYLGSVGMEGAFEAMGEGNVDLNWAKEHHNLWVEEEMGRGARNARGAMRPAE
jgi:formate dehydrogenase subunit gamma